MTIVTVRGMPSLLNGRRAPLASGWALCTMGPERRASTYPDEVVRAVVLEFFRAQRRRRMARKRRRGWA